MELKRYLEEQRRGIDERLDQLLPSPAGAGRTVVEAMRYAVLGGGKRLRPVLLLAAHEACGGRGEEARDPACALELIHTYSLIHDDLPSMDDDELRRGRPTVHRAFGEPAAILAGDALLTLGFELLGSRPVGRAHAARRAESVVLAARASGVEGMVGGQIADLEAERREIDAGTLEWIHLRKTGALFAASCEIGALHAAAEAPRAALAVYGRKLGLAFQITDDLLDLAGAASTLGKTPGKDERRGKATYPSIHGVDACRSIAAELLDAAVASLRNAGVLTPALEALAAFATSRTT
jgi:geranylgeranyl diphosphate synthase type II